jgi:hypothetical protein
VDQGASFASDEGLDHPLPFCRISKDDRGKSRGIGCAVDLSFKTLSHEFGQESAVIEMSMSDEDGSDLGRSDWKGLPIPLP